MPEHSANVSAQAWLCPCAESTDIKTYSLEHLLLTLKKCLFFLCSNIFHCWLADWRARRDFICSIWKILVYLTLFFQEAAADDEKILRSTREFLIKAHQISGFLGLLECRRLIPTQQMPLLDSFSLELVCCAQTCIPWHRKPSSCLPAPFRSTACMLSACCQIFPYSLSSWQERKSRVRGQRKSRVKACEWWGHHS